MAGAYPSGWFKAPLPAALSNVTRGNVLPQIAILTRDENLTLISRRANNLYIPACSVAFSELSGRWAEPPNTERCYPTIRRSDVNVICLFSSPWWCSKLGNSKLCEIVCNYEIKWNKILLKLKVKDWFFFSKYCELSFKFCIKFPILSSIFHGMNKS
jgi:hypothetical protein